MTLHSEKPVEFCYEEKVSLTDILISILFLSGFFFTDAVDSQDSRGREETIFYSVPPAHEYSDIYLHVKWLWRIFNRTASICQTATWWVLPPYWITIWLIDWCDVNICLFTLWFDSRFLLQQFETGNRWTQTRIDYHPCVTSELTNQVC